MKSLNYSIVSAHLQPPMKRYPDPLHLVEQMADLPQVKHSPHNCTLRRQCSIQLPQRVPGFGTYKEYNNT